MEKRDGTGEFINFQQQLVLCKLYHIGLFEYSDAYVEDLVAYIFNVA